jgi:hypothetical protein
MRVDETVYVTTTVAQAEAAVLAALTERYAYLDIGGYHPTADSRSELEDNDQWEYLAHLAAVAALGLEPHGHDR